MKWRLCNRPEFNNAAAECIHGTPSYRLRTLGKTVVLVIKFSAHGCSLHAFVFAFEIDERAVVNWLECCGCPCQAVEEYLFIETREFPEFLAVT